MRTPHKRFRRLTPKLLKMAIYGRKLISALFQTVNGHELAWILHEILPESLENEMTVKMVYMTASNGDEARKISRSLIEARLAACVNIIDRMRSIFRWEGAIEEAEEVVLIAKTTDTRLAALIEHVRAAHSYDCPCIVSLPVENGHQPFLDWVADEVTGSK